MRIWNFGLSALIFLATSANAGVKILGFDVAKKNVCAGASTNKCVYSSYAMKSTYIGGNTKAIKLEDDGEPDIYEYLARLYTPTMAKGQPFCELKMTDPLRAYAASIGKPYFEIVKSNTIDFKVKAERLIGVGAKIDGVKVAQAAGVDPTKVADVAAAIELAYRNVRKENVHITGVWRAYEINSDIVGDMRATDGPVALKSCQKWLADNNQFLVGGLTGYILKDAVLSSGTESNFETRLKAALGQNNQSDKIASITAEFKKTVEKSAESRFMPNFELLAISRLR